MSKNFLYLAAACSALASACASTEEPDELGQADQEMISLNGTSLNGTALTGTTPAGRSLNGSTLTSVGITGKNQAGATITAGSTTAPPLSGAAINLSTWTGTASNGAAVNLRVDSVLQGTAPNADLWFYGLSYQTTTGWSPLCGLDGASQPIPAVSVAGVWTATASDTAYYAASATKFTLACRTKTIAKCVELGYKTFTGRTPQLTACVRLLRGDYCGTGKAYTVDGTTLNLFDNVGVLADNQAWKPEAEWTAAGAVCINNTNSARYDLLAGQDPCCIQRITKKSTCGTSFGSGTLMIDELP